MISIRPGHSAENVLGHLNTALSRLTDARNSVTSPVDGFNAYNEWATGIRRTLGQTISDGDFAAQVASPRYWSLQTVSPSSYGSPLLEVIRVELGEREQAIIAAKEELRLALDRWGRFATYMAVVDTNVLMWHHSELETFPWHGHLDARPDIHIVVWIPIAVIEQLDGLKQDRGVMRRGTEDYPRRTLARQALRTLRTMFDKPDSSFIVQTPGVITQRVEYRLLMDEPGRVRLGDVDAEIIDRAGSLASLASKGVVVTYDTAMVFRAKNSGVEALLLVEDDGQEPDLVSSVGAVPPNAGAPE